MIPQKPRFVSRRYFTSSAVGCAAAMGAGSLLKAEETPAVTNPRATSGDKRHEPDWDQKLTLTVGPKKADLVGNTEKVIQAGVDYLARLGGGTLRVLPGTYAIRNSVFLSSGIRLLGSGADSILKKEPSTTVKLADDSDWYDQEITLANADGFEVGDGICLQSKDSNSGQIVIKRTLIAQSGKRFKLDRGLRKNVWISGGATASTLFPILTGQENSADVLIEDITLDGNRSNNENLNGNYAGCIFLQDCNRYTIRNVTAQNYNGDGMSWQVCHDVLIENCRSTDHAGLGLHPGSGSQRPIIRKNKLERNKLGLFFCWGIKYGLAEDNFIDANGSYGISIGHCDTDNLIRNNEIRNSGKIGILFRDDARGKDFWPHRNRLANNRILDSGPADGVAIDVRGKTREVTLEGNDIVETRAPMNRTAVRIGSETQDIKLAGNKIQGFSTEVDDQRK